MARKAAKQDWVEYVPEVFGIRADFLSGLDKEPVTLEIHGLSAGESREIQKATIARLRKDRTIDSPNAERIDREVFSANVRNVRNYSLVPADEARAKEFSDALKRSISVGEEVAITTGDELWAIGEREIIDEVRRAVESASQLEDGRLDSLRSRFGGTPPATNP